MELLEAIVANVVTEIMVRLIICVIMVVAVAPVGLVLARIMATLAIIGMHRLHTIGVNNIMRQNVRKITVRL